MSTPDACLVSCPVCAGDFDVLAQAIALPSRDDLREAITARLLRRARCSGCDLVLEADQRLVYIDFEREQWIYCCTDADRGAWRDWETYLRADLKRIHSVHRAAERLRARVVFGYEELREKIVIREAGLDDALIECVKVRALAAQPDLVLADAHLVVERIGGDDAIELRDVATDKTYAVPKSWLGELDRATLARRFPEFFVDGYVNVARMG